MKETYLEKDILDSLRDLPVDKKEKCLISLSF